MLVLTMTNYIGFGGLVVGRYLAEREDVLAKLEPERGFSGVPVWQLNLHEVCHVGDHRKRSK